MRWAPSSVQANNQLRRPELQYPIGLTQQQHPGLTGDLPTAKIRLHPTALTVRETASSRGM